MIRYLVDTNAISELIKPVPRQSVVSWFRDADTANLYASVITLGEIRLGVEKLPKSRRRSEIENWLRTGLPEWFGPNLLPVTGEIADRWGRITARMRQTGFSLATADGLIAATAIEHDLTLVTRNVKDFAGLEVTIFDPWTQLR